MKLYQGRITLTLCLVLIAFSGSSFSKELRYLERDNVSPSYLNYSIEQVIRVKNNTHSFVVVSSENDYKKISATEIPSEETAYIPCNNIEGMHFWDGMEGNDYIGFSMLPCGLNIEISE